MSVLLMNALMAAVAALGARRRSALRRFAADLKLLARELDDARALTRVPDLSDSLGRSQLEVRSLLGALADEARDRLLVGGASQPAPHPTQARTDASGYGSAAAAADWPYLGL